MPFIRIPQAGAIGVIKDIGAHELPVGAWSDALNIRFLDGAALQFHGHSEVYAGATEAPQYIMPVDVAGERRWIYATASKCFAVSTVGDVAVHNDITHAVPRVGTVNGWTGVSFGGIPLLNVESAYPMYWDLATDFQTLPNWPVNTYCKSLRSFKNMLIALNVTKAGVEYPHMLKWSNLADPGALPTTWDESDPTQDAGELPIVQGQGGIVDGLELKDSFIVYKENSAHRIDYVGGAFILSNKQIFGMTGLLNRNCAVEFDGYHLAVTSSDIVVHDGASAVSVLDKKARRDFFQGIDAEHIGRVFAFKNPFLNEIFIAYPEIGSSVCNRALVYNYVDKTVSFRTLPNLNHAACGAVDPTLAGAWGSDADSWGDDLTTWNGPDFTPSTVRVIMASADAKLYLLDGSASFGGQPADAYLERRGLGFDAPETMKLIKSVRARISGNTGSTVTIKIGGHNTDPQADPEYPVTMTHTIGDTVSCDCMAEYRYPAIRFETGTAGTWKLDSYDMQVDPSGAW